MRTKTLNTGCPVQVPPSTKHERVDHQEKEPKVRIVKGNVRSTISGRTTHSRTENDRAYECRTPALHMNAADEVGYEQQ